MSDLVANVEAERNLIAVALAAPSRVDEMLEIVTVEDFYDGMHQQFWSVLADMRRNNEPTDPARVMEEMRRQGKLARLQTLLLDLTTRTFAVPEQSGYYSALVIQAARQRELQQLGIRLGVRASHPDADPDGLLDDLDSEIDRLRNTRAVFDELPPTMDELADRDNTRTWVVPGLIADHDRVITVAHEGHGKSVLMFQVAASVAAGVHPFTHQPIEPHPVLVVDCENDPDAVSERAQALLAACIRSNAHPGTLLRYMERPGGLELTSGADLSWLGRLVSKVQPKLLAIGPLYRLTEFDLAKEEHSRAVMVALDRVRLRSGSALLMEAHVGNEGKDGSRPFRPYGASSWRRWAGIGMSMKPAAGFPLSAHIYRMTDYRGKRSARDWPEFVAWDSRSGWPWRGLTAAQVQEEKLLLEASERRDY